MKYDILVMILKSIKDKIFSDDFKQKHKTDKKFFTRDRKLPFAKMILLMTKKSIKSLQNLLNETQEYLSTLIGEDLETITKSAFTQAKEKLNYTAFIELSNDIRDMFYKHVKYTKYKGFRLLGVDGSIITLPNEEDIEKEFCSREIKDRLHYKNKTIIQARFSTLYDLLNDVVIDAHIADIKTSEFAITQNIHLKHIDSNDLLIFDRGYPSYELFATITAKYNANYLVRMKRNIYKKYTKQLFDKNSNLEDIVVTLTPPTKDLKNKLQEQNLPLEIKVRLVKVVLDNGEIEVLATSILDQDILKTNDFKELYFKRWKIETFYEIIKNRLNLENFTGKSALSVKQDFYATMFISNMETLVTYDTNKDLEVKAKEQNTKYEYRVNKSISFNTIKNHCFEMLFTGASIEKVLIKMSKLFLMDTVPIRPNRKYKRPDKEAGKNTKAIKSANFYKRKKKSVF